MRIYQKTLERWDRERGTSLVRELEMAVDRLVEREPRYAVQFWYDMRLYGLGEARSYLMRFIDSQGWSRDVEGVNAFSELVERIKGL